METVHNPRRHNSTNRGNSYNPYLQRHGEVFRYKHSGSSGSSSWVLWGPNSAKKSQKSKPSQRCCGVLLASVIFLVLLLVITIAALAIYMGALRIDSQHLELIFDSSFRVIAGDNYNPSLENSTSNLFKEKSKRYKSMIEKLYNASVLSPAIKYCGVIGFKRGSLIVFYRIILDRRKIPRSLGNVEELVKSILVDEISSRKSLAFKNIKVDEQDIQIKRYFGVSLSSSTEKVDNTTSEAQSEYVSPSINADDNTITLQSHSSSPEKTDPSSSFNSKRKYSTSYIQRKVTPNSFEPSDLETKALSFDTHSSTVPPHKSVFGSFTIMDKPHFGDVFTAATKPSSNQLTSIAPTSNIAQKRTPPFINRHSDPIETADYKPVINKSEIGEVLMQSSLELLAHNSFIETNKHNVYEGDKNISEKNLKLAPNLEISKPKEEISGFGEAHVVELPAASSNQELLLSPHGTLHSIPTTYRPHSSKNRHSDQKNLPPEIVVTTVARKATPSYLHRNEPKQNSNDVQKQVFVLKEKPTVVNENQFSKRRKDSESRTSNKNSHLIHASSINIQKNTEDYDSELKSISSFLTSEFPVLQKIGNLEEVLRAYKMNRTMSESKKKFDLSHHESAIKRGDVAVMESSHEYQYAAPVKTPGYHHSPVVTLLPVRSNVGPGKPLRPRPHLGTINNIGTTTVTTLPLYSDDDLDYSNDQKNISLITSQSIPKQQFSQSYPNNEINSLHSGFNKDSSKYKDLGFLEFSDRFNRESVMKKPPLVDKDSKINIFKGQKLDYGFLNMRDFLLPNPSNISEHAINDFSESLLDRIFLDGSTSFKREPSGHNAENHIATTEESQKVILNTEVVTSTSVKVSYGEGTASYTEATTSNGMLRRPKRRENFRQPKISNIWNNSPLLNETQEKKIKRIETQPLIERTDRSPKMAQDFLLHSNIHKMKFDRSKKEQGVDGGELSDRIDHGRAPFVVYATSLENSDNLFSYGSEQHKELLKERDGSSKVSVPKKSERTDTDVDDTQKVVVVMSTRNSTSFRNENKTLGNTEDKNKTMTQSLLSQMVDKLNRVITNESSVSSLKYLIDQISQQHLKQSHHHDSETNISTKAIPSSFNFNQVNGIPILTKVFTKVSKSNSTNKEQNQTEYLVNLNRSECEMNSSFRCGNGECVSIGSKCNQLVDCADGSDEKNCSCADFLKSQFLSRKICDGIIDCWDFSDEYECEWCSPGQYICPNSRVCIERVRLCDGIKDCPLGDDEKQCINLFPMEYRSPGSYYLRNSMQQRRDGPQGVLYERTDNYPKHVLQDGEDSYLQNTLYPVYHDAGFLMIQKEGQWGKLCMNQINNFIMKSLKWKISDLGKAICKSMTFRNLNEIESVADISNDESIYYELSMNAINSSASSKAALLFQKTKCSQKQVVAVNCSSLECGIRPQANNIWGSVNLTRSMRHSRIVGGGNARLGAWPWQAALYKEGEFQCGATLISDRWLLSAGHCFYRAQDDYWVARLGTLRRGTKLPSPYEQLRPISKIILHPQYVDAGFINDISILKMKSPVQFSNYVRPICLPHTSSSLTDGTMCTVVGWGQLFEIGRVFPDTLQEVQLPIISTAECRKRTLFLPLYRVTENMFCAGFERGGRDACLGDSGGPLMCQESDGRWSLLGVTSNGYGCARANRPGVYTKVSNYISWLYANMGATEYNMAKNETYMSRQHVCNGHRCPLGECLPKARVCNGYMECSDGSDEQGCW